jgi:hypothetical protein
MFGIPKGLSLLEFNLGIQILLILPALYGLSLHEKIILLKSFIALYLS